MHEASLHDENCFVTLTYDDENLPTNGSLDRAAFPKFMKRLRKRYAGKPIRYYHSGEYGDRFGRPHYHAILFGHDFADKTPLSTRGSHQVWRSTALEDLWHEGLSELGAVTFESCAYVARYVTKKVTGLAGEWFYQYEGVEPEYATMSRRPGIGKDWIDKFGCEVYPEDGVVHRGRLIKPPRYYDVSHEIIRPEEMASVKRKRKKKIDPDETRTPRLMARRDVKEARVNLNQGGSL